MMEASKTLCLCNCDLALSSEYRTGVGIPSKRLSRFKQRSDHKPPMLVFYGHGNDTEMIGQDRKAVIDLENARLLKGWVVYAMACNTAKVLGPAIVEAGGLAYIGFDRHFKFISYTHKVFGECANCVVKKIVDGTSLKEAISLTKDRFDYCIEKYKKKRNQTNDPQLKAMFEKTFKLLMHDKSGLTLLGNSQLTLR